MRRVLLATALLLLASACEASDPAADEADVSQSADVLSSDVAVTPPDPCDGVQCPDAHECFAGECVILDDDCIFVDCGPCELCEVATADCVSTCAADEVCHQDACCRPDCEGRECGDDGCGGSCGQCDYTAYCDQGQCIELPCCWGCQLGDDFAYCDAVIVTELAIAAPADSAASEPGCCCDYDGDGVVDNAVGELLGDVLDRLLSLDRAQVNGLIAEQLASGHLLVLFEMIGLTGMDATDFFNLNFFLGEDTDDDATNNFSGDAEFTVAPASLTDDGEALIQFQGASLDEQGVLRAPGVEGEYGELMVPVRLPQYGLDLILRIDGVRLEAQLCQTDGMYGMADGRLCGFIREDQIFALFNAFAAANCACLGLDGELMLEDGEGGYDCADTSATTCDPAAGGVEEICDAFHQYCSIALTVLPGFLDVDSDDDGVGDAISLGATFGATSAVIVEGAVE